MFIPIPFINKVISISTFDLPTYPMTGITNVVVPITPKRRKIKNRFHVKQFVIFLEYDYVSKRQLSNYLSRLSKTVEFYKAYVFRSRPGSNDHWHVIIPEVCDQGTWLTALMESGADNSYKSMSMKRGYSVLRISDKREHGAPEYAFTFKPKWDPDDQLPFFSSWHCAFLEKAYGLKIDGPKYNCNTKLIAYFTGHI